MNQRWKLTRNDLADPPDKPPAVHRLDQSPNEFINLAGDPAQAVMLNQLKAALEQWSARTADYLPTKRTPDEFDRVTGEPDHSVRKRPRPSKHGMFGTNGKY